MNVDVFTVSVGQESGCGLAEHSGSGALTQLQVFQDSPGKDPLPS